MLINTGYLNGRLHHSLNLLLEGDLITSIYYILYTLVGEMTSVYIMYTSGAQPHMIKETSVIINSARRHRLCTT